jgi:KDO2-lipid IV(A) lauroyltransferase
MENYHLYRFGIWLASVMPLWLAHFLASVVSEISFIFWRRRRRIVYANLEHVLPPGTPYWKRWSVARGAFRNFSYSVVDFFRVPRLTLSRGNRYIAEITGWENLQATWDSGRGGIFVSIHMGSWELVGAYLGLRGVPITVAALAHKDPRINQIFLGNREARGIEVVPVGGAMAKLEDALTRRRLVVLVVDRAINERGAILPFFGQPTRVPDGHSALALRTGAWIVPSVTYRRPDGKLVIDFAEPIIPDPEQDTADDLTLRCLKILEGYIRQRPDQWSMFNALWNDA